MKKTLALGATIGGVLTFFLYFAIISLPGGDVNSIFMSSVVASNQTLRDQFIQNFPTNLTNFVIAEALGSLSGAALLSIVKFKEYF